jgi:hypothetical protein
VFRGAGVARGALLKADNLSTGFCLNSLCEPRASGCVIFASAPAARPPAGQCLVRTPRPRSSREEGTMQKTVVINDPQSDNRESVKVEVGVTVKF